MDWRWSEKHITFYPAIKKDKFYLFYGAVELREKLAQPEEATQLSPFQPASAINSLREKLAH